jgi:hypothetical protein
MVGPEAPFVDGERAPHQGLCLGQPVGRLQQLGQIVEADGDVGMVGPEVLLVDGKRTPVERLGLGEPVGVLRTWARLPSAMAYCGWSSPCRALVSSMERWAKGMASDTWLL